ncbi:MAG: PEGA domain-containing protein [Deltaproteobacteria bacterium]|nr:PEGA domain-containing protein [Deltaproteobacteria bacterium]MDQ3298258.1 PEGA domain-containing protein [Myxococcota bacterium]
MRGLAPTLLAGLLLVVWMTSPAYAGREVGVVVVGESTMQPQLVAQLEAWLRQHGHQLVPAPLPPEAINTLIDCFVIEDEVCARKVIEKRAKAATVVFARVDLQAGATADERTVTITAYWFEKAGGDAIAERRFCERCTDLTLRSTADELMAALARATTPDSGHLKLTTSQPGARVAVDGKPVGVTPLDYELPAGPHRVVVSHGGADVVRDVTIVPGEATLLDLEVERPRSRRMLPTMLLGGGGALFVTGAVLFAIDEDVPPPVGEQPEFYRNTAAAGVGLMITGALAGGLGAYLLFSSKSSSVPVASVTSHSGYVGWAGSF